jgi:hypothetical protein
MEEFCMTAADPQAPLKDFEPQHDFFVGIDSDGCAFDTMEIKHKECFIPNIIKHWGLQPVSKYAREAGEFVNLYSKWRGINRFPALLMVFDLLADRAEVQRRGVRMPEVTSLRQWAESETRLGNPALKAVVEKTSDPVLQQALVWSEAVNASIADMVHGIPPFPFLCESSHSCASRSRSCAGRPMPSWSRPLQARRFSGNGKSTTSRSTAASSRDKRWAPRRSTSNWPRPGSIPRTMPS